MKNQESSLSRLWSHNEEHECAALSAFRKAEDCGKGREILHKENQERNKSLAAKLSILGYGVTDVSGRYPEGGKVVKEWSFFVVNLQDDPKFFDEIIKLGIKFDQDSVLIVPKGAIQNKAEAYLYGTNHCENSWLGWQNKNPFEKGKVGYASPIYTTYVGGRPFIFEDVEYTELDPPISGFGFWSRYSIAKKAGLV